MDASEIDNIFKYHSPKEDQPQRYEGLRSVGRQLAFLIEDSCPDSREKSVAITKVQEAIMWANASIAINE